VRIKGYLVLLTSLFILVAPGTAQDQSPWVRSRIADLFVRGFALLPDRQSEAVAVFEEVVLLDSTNVLAWRQLGSLYVNTGKSESAIRCFTAANRLMPSDTTRLQLAYLHTSLKQNQRAYELFDSLSESPDSSIRAKAAPAAVLLSLMQCQDLHPWWYRVQAYPYFDTRFHNLIATASYAAGYHLTQSHLLGLIATVAVTKDTRTEGGAYPEIYSDNVLIADAGVRIQPLRGMVLDVLGGLGVDLTDRGGRQAVREDFRALLSYGGGVYPEIAVTPKLEWVGSPFLNGYSSFGYYSRYHNAIGYLQVRAGTRAAALHRSALDVYTRGNLSFDTKHDFYNNTLEAGLGIAVVPDYTWGLSIAADFLWGTYWSAEQKGNIYGKNYKSVRISILFDRFLCL
jgi:tetratricopeptide (TPR) repeat protein